MQFNLNKTVGMVSLFLWLFSNTAALSLVVCLIVVLLLLLLVGLKK